MYRNYFNLKRKPFSINTDPDFLWIGPCHARVLTSLSHGLDRGGVLVLTGDVGTGKTTLVNKIVKDLPPSLRTARIPDPCLELNVIFSSIARSLGFDFHSEKKYERSLVKFLGKVSSLNQHCLVIVDEAQRIGVRFLNALYSWQELGNGQLPITVLLVGQNEFEETLSLFDKGRFLEKTTLKQKILPLNRKDTADYIRFRMLYSGAQKEIFLESALDHIAILSMGYPRTINILCDHCLLLAHRKGIKAVDDSLVDIAAKKLCLAGEPVSIPLVQNKVDKGLIPEHQRWVMPTLVGLGFVFLMVYFIAVGFRYYDSAREVSPGSEPSFKIAGKIVEKLTHGDDVIAGNDVMDHGDAVEDVMAEDATQVDHEQSPLGRHDAVEPVSKISVDSETGRSVKNFVDEVFNFKAVDQRMHELSQKTENMTVPTRMEEPVPLSRTQAKPFEKKDPGSETPDPGDVITWLLERD